MLPAYLHTFSGTPTSSHLLICLNSKDLDIFGEGKTREMGGSPENVECYENLSNFVLEMFSPFTYLNSVLW